MKNISILAALIIISMPGKAQLLQPKKCEIQVKRGTISHATLFAANDSALIIIHKRRTDTVYRLDTVPLRYIETIKLKRNNKVAISTLVGAGIGAGVGIITGSIISSSPVNSTPTGSFDNDYIGLLQMTVCSCGGTAAGAIAGFVVGILPPKNFKIEGDVVNFQRFRVRYKK